MEDMAEEFEAQREHDDRRAVLDERDALRAENKRLRRAYDAVMGHGVTLPAASYRDDEYRRGYAHGVDSQRQAAKEAMEENDD